MELIDILYNLLKKISKRQWLLASILPTALILIAHLLPYHEYNTDSHTSLFKQADASLANGGTKRIRLSAHGKPALSQSQRFLEDAEDDFEARDGDDQNANDDGNNDDANDQNAKGDDANVNDDEDDDDYFDNNDDDGNGQNDDDAQQGDNNNANFYDDAPVYIDDDYIDDYYAFIEDTKPKLDFFPLTGRQAIGLLFISMGVIIASGGGIGGGGIILPIYILALGIEPIDAIPLTSVTVFGGACGSTFLNIGKRHPLADRTIIDWDVVMVMQPLILSGSFIGTLMHKALSDKFLVVLLVVFLSIAANYNLAVAKRMHRAEQAYLEMIRIAKSDLGLHTCQSAIDPFRAPTVDSDSPKNTLFPSRSDESSTGTPALPSTRSPKRSKSRGESSTQKSSSKLTSTEKAEILIRNPDFVSIRTDLSEEMKSTPRNKVIAVTSMFAIVIFTNVMVGGGAFESPWGIICGSFSYWIVHVCLVAFLIACGWAAQTYLTHRHEIREIVGGFEYIQGDIRWDTHNSLFYAFIFGSAGVMAGMFGIGGGIVTTPVMLAAMHVHPEVAAATSSVMVLFTSSLSFASYSLFGMIHWDYSAAVWVIGFCSCIFGNRVMRSARRKTKVHGRTFKRNSLLAYSVGGVLLLSAFLMSVQYIFVVIAYDDGENLGDICTPQISG